MEAAFFTSLLEELTYNRREGVGVMIINKKKMVLFAVSIMIAALNMRPAINSISPILQELTSTLQMNASTASLLTAVPVLCMGVFSPLAASLAQKFGLERIIGYALCLIGIGTLLRFFTYSTGFLIMTSLIAGVGIAAMGPLLSGFIKKYFNEHVPFMISLYTAALTTGAVAASWLSVSIYENTNSWRVTLSVWVLFAIAAIPVWWQWVLKNSESPSGLSVPEEVKRIPWKSQRAWLLTLSFGCMAMIFYSATAWIAPLIENQGYSKQYAANILTLFTATQIPVGFLLPVLLKKVTSRLFWLWFAAGMEALGLLLLALEVVPWVGAIFIGIGAGTLFPLNLLLPIDLSKNADEAAGLSAMTQSAGYIIGALGPIIIGTLVDLTGQFYSTYVFLLVVTFTMSIIQWFAMRSVSRNRG